MLNYNQEKKVKKLFTVFTLLLLTSNYTQAANSISGSTDFRVTLPEILVLYHWDDAHLILEDIKTTPENDSDAREISDTSTHDLNSILGNSSYTITGDVNTTTPITILENGTINVTLKNSWGVRSLSTDNVTLNLVIQNDKLLNVVDTTKGVTPVSSIIVSDPILSTASTDVTINNSTEASIPSGWNPIMGDINFKLDLSNADKSGEYNTRGVTGKNTSADESNDTFLLTLIGN